MTKTAAKPDPKSQASPEAPAGERIAKVIARAGLCSRREAEKLIAAGRVEVDGQVIETPATLVTRANKVRVDGQALPAPEPARLWRYHKPKGQITTRHDPQGRPTVFDHLPPDLPRLQPVGRLDLTTEGLLLFTNDGGLKRRLELPATGWVRRYRVRVFGKVTQDQLDGLAEGVTVHGIRYGPVVAKLERQLTSNCWLTIAIKEGKNREVRRICEHLELGVNRLIRMSYGPFQLGRLKPGEIEEVPGTILAEQLGGDGPEKAAKRPRTGWAKSRPKTRGKPGRAQSGRKKDPRHANRRGPK